jgi:hypothetical protein
MDMTPEERQERDYCRSLLLACPTPRDRLPYTPEFDELLGHFRRRFPNRKITENEFWRLLASAAKQGWLAGKRGTATTIAHDSKYERHGFSVTELKQ